MYIKRCIYIIALLGLSACGGGGGESASENQSIENPPLAPIEISPETPSAQVFDLTGQSGSSLAAPQKVAGTQSESNSVVSTSFSNAIGTLRYANTNSNVEGNLTFGITASDTDVMNKVSLYLPNVARSFVLCSDNCTPDFQATITGFNPQAADEVAGSLRIELIVEDSLGNSAVVDAISVNWQPIQISALSASREGGIVNVSWAGNSSLQRYNLYAATEVGITSENALDLDNGIQKLAINGTTAEFSDLDESKNYHLLVTGIDNGGESGKSVPFSLAKLGGTANLPPVANNDNYQVNEDETITVNILDNDFDPEGLPLTVDSILLEPLNGTLTLDDTGNFIYGARANFHGSDSASYRVIDTEGATAEATVFFEILPVNDNPIAVADTFGVDVSGNINAANTNLLSNDSDIDGDDLTIITTPITAPQLGTLSINADGSFSYQSSGVLTQNDQFVYQVSDGKGGTATAIVTILPNGSVLPPIALNDNYTVSEDTTLVISSINLGILANDSDPNDLPFELQELLLIEPEHGQLNLALDGTFTYIPNSNFFGVDQFQYQIKNSADLVTQAFVTITINATADAPIALDDNYQTQEDIQLVVNAVNGLLINDVDFDDSTLKVNTTPINSPQNGNVVLAEDGGFSYLPNQDFNGIDSFTYQVISGTGLSNTANVNISVVPLNDAPVVANDIATTNEDTEITVDVLANDSDADGDVLSLLSVSLENGTAVIVNEKLTITPALNYFGEITATYTITDSINAPQTGSLVLTVLPINDAPIAIDDRYSLVEDAVFSVLPSSNNKLLSNDSDIEGDTLTVNTTPIVNAKAANATINTRALSDVTNGNLTLNSDGSFTYVPNRNFNGTDSFVYQISDGNGGTAQASVTLTVAALNDAPEITVNKAFTTLEDINLTKLVSDINNLLSGASDADGDSLSINTTPVSNVSNGRLILSADGAFDYRPNANFNGIDSFSYQVLDGNGASTEGNVALTVSAVNDVPVAVADAYSINEDTVLNILVTDANNLLNNDTDVDSDNLTTSLVSTTSNGSLTLNSNGAFSYSPNLNFNSTDSFVYQISDGNGGIAQASVTLTINEVNDVPVAVTDIYSVDEGTILNVLVTDANNPLNNDTDADGDSLTASLVSTTSNGTLILNDNGAFSYTPNVSFNGSDSFTYQVSDGNGGTAQTSVLINVIENNDPVALDDSYSFNEDFTWVRFVTDGDQLLSNDTDIDGDVLTVNTAPILPVSNGTLTLNADGSFTYVPEADFFGQDSFIYQISDGRGGTAQATVTLIVHAINDTPIVESTTKSFTFDEDSDFSKAAIDADNLLGGASDVDGDTLTVMLTSDDTTNGSLIFNADGAFSYSPNNNFFGVETFSYRVTDNIIPSDVITVELNIQAVNDAPVSADAPYTFSLTELATNGDVVGTISALDIEGDSFVYSLTAGDTSLFEINPLTGVITVKGTLPFDFETNQTHTLTTTIIDDGSPLIASVEIAITINITDVADDTSIEEASDFGRTVFGGLELTGKKTQAQLTDSVTDGSKVYFVGNIDNVDKDIYMVAYKDDGTLDSGFGINGTKTFDYGANEYAKAIVNIDNDYFITFERNENNFSEVCFIKVDNDGDIDDSFGDNGLRCTNEQKVLTINDAVFIELPTDQGDAGTDIDAIVAVGKVQGDTDDDLLVIRVDKNGDFQVSTIYDAVTDTPIVFSPHIMLDVTGLGLNDEGVAVYNPHNNEIMIAGNVLTSDGDYDIFSWIFNPQNADGSYVNFNNSTPKTYDVGGIGADDKVGSIDGENTGSGDHTTHVVGSTVLASGEQDAFIIELDSTAAYVPGFGVNGIAIYDVDGVATTGVSEFTGYVYNYNDDNLLLSGNLFDGNNYMPFATRVFLDGSVDTLNYGNNGYQLADYSGDNAYAKSMSLDDGEGIWVAGYVEDGSDKDMAITVFDSSGDLFDQNDFDDGKNTLTHSSLYSDDSAAEILQIQSGAQAGKYLIASIADDGTNQHIILTRLTSTGQLDTTFDSDGNKQLKIGTSAKVNGMFELTSGNLIVYGDVTEEDSANGFIARIDQNGVLDVTFASNGIYKTTGISANNIHFNQAKQDALGNIIAVGSFENGSINAFVLRLTSAGALDTLFNSLDTQGYVIGADTDNYNTVAIDSSNNIYAAGNRDIGDKDFLMVKYSVAGIQGVVASIDPNPGLDDSVEKLIFDSNNDLYWVGNEDSILPRVVIVKTNTSGTLDTSFSGDGIGYFRMSSGLELVYEIVVSDAVIDSNDNIVVVGSSAINLAKRTKMLGRIKPDGDLDADFDSVGYYRPSNCPNDANLESIVLLNSSSFVVAGQCYQNGNSLRNLHISHFTMN